ncbi:MAG: alpha/beta hydrolase [Pseudomonadota bacterium]
MSDTFEFTASDGHKVFCYRWLPHANPRALVHIAHGMGEHAGRYDFLASRLVDAGYAVYANDHRGHGRTAEVPGQFGEDGWNRAIADLYELIASHQQAWPGKPLILLGHSMGAMLTQQYMATHGNTLDAVILSGSPGFAGRLQGWVSRLLVRFECWRVGPLGSSPLLQRVLFGSANKAFEQDLPEPTGFEWLSRDNDQVRAYIDDPLCGFVPCPGSLSDIFAGASWTQTREAVSAIPPVLPVYVFSGTDDPVHNRRKNMDRMLLSFGQQGITPETRFYAGGRHEMLNETNREEVVADVINWLNQRY